MARVNRIAIFVCGCLIAASSCADPSSDDMSATPCVGGELCVGDLVCVGGFCVMPDDGESGDADGESGDGESGGDGDGDGDGDCEPGTVGCTCDGGCGLGLECFDGLCATSCGDGKPDAGEECDDGNLDNTDACLDDCVAASCGDGYVGPGEGCDDGNSVNDDDCTNDCALASCGDGSVNAGEGCDDGNASDSDGCLSTCVIASCGDSFVYMGVETCDDGNLVATDACTDTCVDAACGDMIVHEGVEACDDGDDDNTDDCVQTCELAACGDGFVHEGVEPCDDGNDIDIDACTSVCEAAACGDGFTQPSEECDDGNMVDLDGCRPDCTLDHRLVFVTSNRWAGGSVGGLNGGDAKCQALADAANLPGTYLAWLGTGGVSPSTRFTQSMLPYRLVTGTKVADNWADLIDGSIDAAIDRTETGGDSPTGTWGCNGTARLVWTGVSSSGTVAGPTCAGWTDNGGVATGKPGETNPQVLNAGNWTNCGGTVTCNNTLALYCFQQ